MTINSKGDYAYTILDVDIDDDSIVASAKAVEGIIAVRVLA